MFIYFVGRERLYYFACCTAVAVSWHGHEYSVAAFII